MENEHQWKKRAKGFGKRFAFGLALTLSLTLVAFEWSTTKEVIVVHGEFTTVDPFLDDPLVIRILPEAAPVEQKKPKQTRTEGPIKLVDEKIELQPVPIVIDLPDPGPTIDPTALLGAAPDEGDGAATTITVTPPTLHPEILPHFMDCLKGDIDRTNKCTEARIQRHLERYLKIPESVRGVVATTVTFEIGPDGNIGRLHCGPRVAPEVEEEIARVIRSLPEFQPGTQGGHPVAVYYQIPLRLRRN